MMDTKNDAVFQEIHGKLEFVGDFEGLYKQDDDPWEQSGFSGEMALYYGVARSNLISSIRRIVQPGRRGMYGLEVGCGHGHVTKLLQGLISTVIWEGMDISATAIDRARSFNPDQIFYVADIGGDSLVTSMYKEEYMIIVLGQVLWYVLHNMDRVVSNCHKFLEDGGVLVISQAFLRDQRYGKEIADGFLGILRMFLDRYSSKFNLIEARYDDTNKLIHNDGILVFRRV